jgi:hypothetical protein
MLLQIRDTDQSSATPKPLVEASQVGAYATHPSGGRATAPIPMPGPPISLALARLLPNTRSPPAGPSSLCSPRTSTPASPRVTLRTSTANPSGHYTSVDLWGYDLYPNGFDCSKTSWGSGAVPTYLWDADRKYAPSGVPNNIYEFQGGKSFFILHLSLHIRSLILCRCVRWLGRSFLRYVCSKSHYF